MEITVNGEKRAYRGPCTVSGLLQSLGVVSRSVIVERNCQIVARADMEKEPVQEGDAIEVIRFVGGG